MSVFRRPPPLPAKPVWIPSKTPAGGPPEAYVFQGDAFQIGQGAPGGGVSPITGTLAATEAQDSASLGGILRYSGTLAATEAQDVAALAGTLRYSGTLTATEAQDVAALVGRSLIQGTIAATEAQDVAALAGTLRYSGTLAATEAQDAVSIAGNVVGALVTGTLAATEAQDDASLAGALRYSGTLAATEAQDEASFDGTTTGGAAVVVGAGRPTGPQRRGRRLTWLDFPELIEVDSEEEAREVIRRVKREVKALDPSEVQTFEIPRLPEIVVRGAEPSQAIHMMMARAQADIAASYRRLLEELDEDDVEALLL